MRAISMVCAVALGAAGCGAARLSASTRYTSVPTYTSSSGGGPSVVYGPDIPAGTRFQAQLNTPIDTRTTVRGQPFYATITQPFHGPMGGTLVPAGTQVIGRVYRASGSRRFFGHSHLAIGVEGLNVSGTYVPITGRVVDARVQSHRNNFIAPIHAQIPTGSTMAIQLDQPLPIAVLVRSEVWRAAVHRAAEMRREGQGGGPRAWGRY
jgi:hypothetical protein